MFLLRHRSLARSLITVVILALSLVAPSHPASGAPAPAARVRPAADVPSWSQPVTVDGSPASVSCPDQSFCMAVDYGGRALSYDGSIWTAPQPVDLGAGLTSVSCPSTTFCMAVDSDGRALSYDGTGWSAPASIDPGEQLESVSCASTAFCAAVDAAGQVLSFDGSQWTAPQLVDSGNELTSVSCPSAVFCVAVDIAGQMVSYDGTSWNGPSLIDSTSENELEAVSCSSATFCMAMDYMGNALTFDGTSWTTPTATIAYQLPVSLSCPTSTVCLATATGVGNAGGPVFAEEYSGGSWTSTTIDSSYFDVSYASDVSCPTTSFCVAVDDAGDAMTYSDGHWSLPDPVDGAPGPTGLSCVSATFCQAVDDGGNAFRFSAGGWSPALKIVNQPLNAVSCASTRFCMAVGEGVAVRYTGTWGKPDSVDTEADFGGIDAVSCPSSTFCVAVDANGGALTYDGTSWSKPKIIGPPKCHFICNYSLSCASSRFCVVVNNFEGQAITYRDGRWSKPAVIDKALSLTAVSCPAESFCVAVDASGRALLWDGSSWSRPRPTGVSALSSVSCDTPTFCMAVGQSSAVRWNGTSWSAPRQIGLSLADRISCPGTSFCVVIGGTGEAVAYAADLGTPVITGITPPSGPTDGHLPVSITGRNLSDVTSVSFGQAHADTANSCSATACAISLPPNVPGQVDVQAITAGGQLSNDTVTFSYGTPDVTVSPSSSDTFTAPIGDLSPAQTVTVTNSGTTYVELAEDFFTTGDFGNGPAGNNCAGALLAPGQSCPISVIFTDPSVGTADASLELFDSAQTQVGAASLGGASTGPIITSVTKVPAQAGPVLVISGSGFGPSIAGLDAGTDTQTPYFELADGTSWSAGNPGGTCDATIDEWSETTIIVTPDAGSQDCPLDPGDSLTVTVTSTANSAYSASGTTPVISTTGLTMPVVTGLSQDDGPESGGGTLTVTGTGLSNVEAVEFGPYVTTDVTPGAGGTSVTVNNVPAATVGQAVSVIVTTSDGLSSSPSSSCWLPHVYLDYCADSYFYLAENTLSLSGGGDFDNTLTIGPSGESGDDTSKTGAQPAQQGESDSSASQQCAGDPSLSGNLSLETKGSAQVTASGTLGIAANGGLPSAVLGTGTLDIADLSTTVTLSGSVTGEIDAPILGVPCALALYIKVAGTISDSISVGVTLRKLAITLDGGFVNGQLIGPTQGTPGSFAITCAGQALSSQDAATCVSITPPAGSVQGSLTASLWLQVGPDEANLGIGPELTFTGSANTTGTISWGACLGLGADAEVDIGPVTLGGQTNLIQPIPLIGSC